MDRTRKRNEYLREENDTLRLSNQKLRVSLMDLRAINKEKEKELRKRSMDTYYSSSSNAYTGCHTERVPKAFDLEFSFEK